MGKLICIISHLYVIVVDAVGERNDITGEIKHVQNSANIFRTINDLSFFHFYVFNVIISNPLPLSGLGIGKTDPKETNT